MKPPVRPPSRGHGLSTTIRRYESGAIGLPDHGCYFTISQSQFEKWACDRRGWFSEVEGLRGRPTVEMHLGTAWDAWKRDVWTWWQERDAPYPASGLDRCVWCAGDGCDRCDDEGGSALDAAVTGYRETLDEMGVGFDQAERGEETLRRMAEGWIAFYEGGNLQQYQVSGVQVSLSRIIVNPLTGEPYQPVMYLTDADPMDEMTPLGFRVQRHRWRLSRTGEQGYQVRWPWYQIGAIDVVMKHRRTGLGMAVDDKASAGITKYEDAVRNDPQLPGYCWLMEPNVEALGLNGVSGFFYEVASTRMHQDPDLLKPKYPPMDELRDRAKNAGVFQRGMTKDHLIEALGLTAPPELSRNTSAFTPSWRYAKALRDHGLPVYVYEDHLKYLREYVDPQCYLRGGEAMLPYSRALGARYSREMFARVKYLADKRRAAATAQTVEELDVSFPRTAICKMGVRCSYTSICAVHADDAADMRSLFDQSEDQVWGPMATPGAGGVHEQREEEHSGADDPCF